MIVTPFGEFDLDNDKALEMWIDAHARRHTVYGQVLKMSGSALLRGTIDGDWMLRHASRHLALATVTGLDLSGMTQGLAIPHVWQTPQELCDWHELHNRIHLKLDKQLGL